MGKSSKGHGGPKRRSGLDAPPAENDWVYACPKGLPTAMIATVLGVVGQPITEVSARTWQQNWHMANTFMEA